MVYTSTTLTDLFKLSELTLTKNWFIKKYKRQESWSSKNHPHKYVQHQVLYQIQQQIYKILLFIFLLTEIQSKNESYNWLKIIADNWVVISCGWISLSKTSVWIRFIVNVIIKNLCNLNLKLLSAIFYQIFIFAPNDSPLKTMKNVFYFI